MRHAVGQHGQPVKPRMRADTYTQSDVLSIEQSIVGHVEYTLARSRYKFDDQEAYQATSLSLRDRLIESWNDTQQYFKCAPTLPAEPVCPACKGAGHILTLECCLAWQPRACLEGLFPIRQGPPEGDHGVKRPGRPIDTKSL